MKVLVSPQCLDEARLLVELGVDIIDVKNPAEGSLGAPLPSVVQEIAQYCNSRGVPASATLGDLPFKPGTAALAAFGLAQLGVRYIKAGLYGSSTRQQATELLSAVVDAAGMVDETIAIVAAGYADYRAFGGVAPHDLLHAASATRCAVVMLDTADKRGGNLVDVLGERALGDFVASAHDANLIVALAGSIGAMHFPVLARLRAEIVGVRGALCHGRDRSQRIDARLAREFLGTAKK
jgi:hypothetical protein